MFDIYWDLQNNAPKEINDNDVMVKDEDLKKISSNLTKYMFQIKANPDDKEKSSCHLGQWSSLKSVDNSANAPKDLIDYSRGVKIPPTNYEGSKWSLGDPIWIQPGIKDTVFSSANECSDNMDGSGDNTCAYVLAPIIADAYNQGKKSPFQTPIIGFACLNIIKADKKISASTKPVIARVVAADDPVTNGKCKVSGTGGGAVIRGVTLPPKLANYSGNTY
jgi:hypothetical protein